MLLRNRAIEASMFIRLGISLSVIIHGATLVTL